MKIYSYNQGSASAKVLAQGLGIKRIKRDGKALTIRENVINWGCSEPTRDMLFTEGLVNTFTAVKRASNKLSAFNAMEGTVSIPEWTESRIEASKWLAEGITVVARTILNGHSGKGIFICTKEDEVAMPAASLYVKYIPKKEEYRLHVHNKRVFFIQKKMRKLDVPDDDVNWKVRNHQNGFIYANKDVAVAQEACNNAIAAITALGLDFGAVDIIWNEKQDKYYVLEANTAPGLSGVSVEKYVEQFKIYL
jgi:glutathione synthase/RimK-type ligase-like ATP-grasp enzyme